MYHVVYYGFFPHSSFIMIEAHKIEDRVYTLLRDSTYKQPSCLGNEKAIL